MKVYHFYLLMRRLLFYFFLPLCIILEAFENRYINVIEDMLNLRLEVHCRNSSEG